MGSGSGGWQTGHNTLLMPGYGGWRPGRADGPQSLVSCSPPAHPTASLDHCAALQMGH